jgi:hypothetical protein
MVQFNLLSVRVFMSFWFGIVIVISGGLLGSTPPVPMAVMIGPLVMIIGGLGLVAAGKWFEVFSCVVVAIWGRWWYAQRMYFIWS